MTQGNDWGMLKVRQCWEKMVFIKQNSNDKGMIKMSNNIEEMIQTFGGVEEMPLSA